jgi:hypothetical protein
MTWPQITDASTPEEVAAVRVAMKLEGFTGWFDDPIKRVRESWKNGCAVQTHNKKIIDALGEWMDVPNPDPR